jgi:phospholipase C
MADVLDPAEAERLDAVAPDEGLGRREFLERTARAAGVGLGLAAALGPDRLVAAAAADEGRAARRTGRAIPIDTFVVVMMENRWFDHFLGWMPNADGRQAGLSYSDGAGNTFSTYPLAPTSRAAAIPCPGTCGSRRGSSSTTAPPTAGCCPAAATTPTRSATTSSATCRSWPP